MNEKLKYEFEFEPVYNPRQRDLTGKVFVKDMAVPAMPYMGNKRKLATKILNKIYETVGDFENLYDLFGGGASMSVAGLLASHNVTYNEYNTGVAELLKYLKSGGELPLHFVTRDEFNKHKNNDDWYGGFVKCTYSFGNDQRSYLFGKDIENYKKMYHEVVVLGIDNLKEMSEFCMNYVKDKYGIEQPLNLTMPPETCINKRRLNIRRQLTVFEKDCKNVKRFNELEQLQQLQRLQQLEQLEQLQRLEILNLSYDQVLIEKPNAVIYCDPPYKGTGGYQKEIDHNKFYAWALNSKHPVFISEYNMPDDFIEVASFQHRSIIQSNGGQDVIEKLFWNGKKIT